MISAISSMAWLAASGEVGLDYAESVVWPLGGEVAIKRLRQKVKRLEAFHIAACKADTALREVEKIAGQLLSAGVAPEAIQTVAKNVAAGAISADEIRTILRATYRRHVTLTQNKIPPHDLAG
jgi:hypothetical protein